MMEGPLAESWGVTSRSSFSRSRHAGRTREFHAFRNPRITMIHRSTDTRSVTEQTADERTRQPDDPTDRQQEMRWWECPICGKQSLNTATPNNKGAEGALRSHVHASKGEGHGPKFAFPEEFDPATLQDCITPKNST